MNNATLKPIPWTGTADGRGTGDDSPVLLTVNSTTHWFRTAAEAQAWLKKSEGHHKISKLEQ